MPGLECSPCKYVVHENFSKKNEIRQKSDIVSVDCVGSQNLQTPCACIYPTLILPNHQYTYIKEKRVEMGQLI